MRLLRGDRHDFATFEQQMRDETARHRFDAVIDMVAFQPAEAESLLRAFGGRVKQIVVCSTVCVYGGPMTRVPAADDEPHRPVTQYGRNKSAIERTLLAANGRDGLHTTVLRPSFTTGEGHTLGGAVMFDDSTLERFRQGRPGSSCTMTAARPGRSRTSPTSRAASSGRCSTNGPTASRIT